MSNGKVSIIIPIYNVEKYLDYCIKSVLAQDYENLEILLVDDGSTDSSGSMCDEYAKLDSRVKVIHKENGGLSSARNAGLQAMSGDYIAFVDSDDYIRIDYISCMLNHMLNDESDLVVCSFRKVINDIDYRTISNDKTNHYVLDCESLKYKMATREIPMYAPGKLYRSDLFEHLEFPEGRLYEDMPTIWGVAKRIKTATQSSEELYFYRQRIDSIINARYKHERMDQVYFSEQMYKEIDQDSSLGAALASRCFFAAADNYTLVSKDFPADIKYLRNALVRYRKQVLKANGVDIKLKVLAIISYAGLPLVRCVGKFYKKYNIIKLKSIQ